MGGGESEPKPHIESDKISSYDELINAFKQSGMESIKIVVGIDFSNSNEVNGTNGRKNLHGLDYKNPYLRVFDALIPFLEKYDDDAEILAFRFGCRETKDQSVAPLTSKGYYSNLNDLVDAYKLALSQCELWGPTTFGPFVKKCIEIEKAAGGKQFLIGIIITDGNVSNPKDDEKLIEEATKYPICFATIGVGIGPFDSLKHFDDELKGEFDNFQFADLSEIEMKNTQPEEIQKNIIVATFNEVPMQFIEMKRLGYLK